MGSRMPVDRVWADPTRRWTTCAQAGGRRLARGRRPHRVPGSPATPPHPLCIPDRHLTCDDPVSPQHPPLLRLPRTDTLDRSPVNNYPAHLLGTNLLIRAIPPAAGDHMAGCSIQKPPEAVRTPT